MVNEWSLEVLKFKNGHQGMCPSFHCINLVLYALMDTYFHAYNHRDPIVDCRWWILKTFSNGESIVDCRCWILKTFSNGELLVEWTMELLVLGKIKVLEFVFKQ